MANEYKNLKEAIKQAIKQNGNQEITGQLLQSTLLNIVETIGNSNVVFKGVINPASTPEASETPVFYINEISRNTQTFSNFGGLKTEKNELAIFIKNNDEAWTKLHIGHMHVQPEVTTSDIAAGAVVSTKLANGAVTSAKIDNSAVDETKIKDESITNSKLSKTLSRTISRIQSDIKDTNDSTLSTAFNIGYFECSTAANNASKVIYNDIAGVEDNAWPKPDSPELRLGGTMRIKMKYATTVEKTKLSICDKLTDQELLSRPIFYKGELAGPGNTWADGEVIEGYFDKSFIFYAKPWYKQIETKDINDNAVTRSKIGDELVTKIDESLSFKGIAINDANKALASGVYPESYNNTPVSAQHFTIFTLRTTTPVYNKFISIQIAIGTGEYSKGRVAIRQNEQGNSGTAHGPWINLVSETFIANTVYKFVAQQVINGAWIPIKAGRDAGVIKEGAIAEGLNTIASNRCAHAEGYDSQAGGDSSHAEGEGVRVSCKCGHGEGAYNYNSDHFIKTLGVGNSNSNRINAEVVYVKATGPGGLPDTSDPKNGYKYLLGIGGYTGKTITIGMKSVQEVISDLESRIATLEEKLKS